MIKPFRIALFSSSYFIVPIIESIRINEGKDLQELSLQQYQQAVSENLVLNFLPPSLVEQLDLENRQIQLDFIVSQPDRLNRSKVVANPVAQYARDNSIPLFTPQKINKEYVEFEDQLKQLDLIIVASFGQIISQKILDFPQFGVINWHPSKLPSYRGATPLQSALAHGDETTALTWMEMDKNMDSGDILVQLPYAISSAEIISEFAENMGKLGSRTWAFAVLLQVLNRQHILPAKPQNHEQATFCQQLEKDDSIVTPLSQSATHIFNHWRAYLLFPGTQISSSFFAQQVKIRTCCGAFFASEMMNPESNIVFEDAEWLQVRSSVDGKNSNKTYLKCFNSSLLEVVEIGLENGKILNFSGYTFSR